MIVINEFWIVGQVKNHIGVPVRQKPVHRMVGIIALVIDKTLNELIEWK